MWEKVEDTQAKSPEQTDEEPHRNAVFLGPSSQKCIVLLAWLKQPLVNYRYVFI